MEAELVQGQLEAFQLKGVDVRLYAAESFSIMIRAVRVLVVVRTFVFG